MDNHDLECAMYVEKLMELGGFEEEFEYWGLVYWENGKRKYYITSEGEKAYAFQKNCLTNNLFATPVERYFKWILVGAGQYERLKQENKILFAQYLQDQYSQQFMEKMSELYLTTANNSTLPILQQLQDQLWGRFDIDGLQLFKGILEYVFEMKKIRMLDYLRLDEWVEREISLCPLSRPALKQKKVFSGFLYENNKGEIQYYSNAELFLTYERKNELDKKGRFTTPIFMKEYFYSQMNDFLETKNHYAVCQKQRCDEQYVDFIKYLKNLPGVVDEKQVKLQEEAMGKLSVLEQQCLKFYSDKWLVDK